MNGIVCAGNVYQHHTDVNEVPGSPCAGAAFYVNEHAANGTAVSSPLASNDPDNSEKVQKQSLSYHIINSVPFSVDQSTDEIIKTGVSDLVLNFT